MEMNEVRWINVKELLFIVSLLTNINKWNLIVKCYHFITFLNAGLGHKPSEGHKNNALIDQPWTPVLHNMN